MLHIALLGGALLYAGYRAYKEHLLTQEFQREAERSREIVINAEGVVDVGKAGKEEKLKTIAELEDERALQREQETNTFLIVSGSALGASLAMTVYPPAAIVVLPLLLYSSVGVFTSAFKGVITHHQLNGSMVDLVAILGTLGQRYYIASSLATVVHYSAERLLLATEDRSKKQMVSIFGQQPRKVWLWRDGQEIETPIEQLVVGDVIVLHAGEMVPIDGKVIQGHATLDQHVLTGESQPVERDVGDSVMAATMVMAGNILVQVEKTGEQTVASRIGEILRNTADYRSSVEAKVSVLSDQMAVPTLLIGGATWVFLGPVSATAAVNCNFVDIARTTSPIGMLNYLSMAAQHGVLVKDGRCLELLAEVDTVVFDKTGTLTLEQPTVSYVHVWGDLTEERVLCLAAAAEYKQSHPIAKAILEAARLRDLVLPSIEDATYQMGFGIKVHVERQVVRVGSSRFMVNEGLSVTSTMHDIQHYCHDNGFSLVYVAVDDQVVGAIELQATLRAEAKEVVKTLKKRGLRTVIISGDHIKPTQQLAQQLEVDDYYAAVLPEGKADLIQSLQEKGYSVCFVGDGINDAIALKTAHVSVSLKGATTVATDTAGIVLMSQNLNQLVELFELSEGVRSNYYTSLATTLIPGALGLGGVFFFHFGIYTTLLIYTASITVSSVSALLPLLRSRKPLQPSVLSRLIADKRDERTDENHLSS